MLYRLYHSLHFPAHKKRLRIQYDEKKTEIRGTINRIEGKGTPTTISTVEYNKILYLLLYYIILIILILLYNKYNRGLCYKGVEGP